jgi:hypothetical protein
MRFLSTILFLLAFVSSSYAQVALSLSSANVSQGQTATLNLTSASGGTASGIQWSLSTTSDIVSIQVAAGPAATAAGKSVSCNGKKCLVSGMNMNVIPDGILATVNVSISPAGTGTEQVQFSGVVGSSPSGAELTGSGSAGVLTIATPSTPPPPPASLSTFTCADSVLHQGDSTVCTLSFTGPAPTAGQAVVDVQASLSAPSTIPVSVGASGVQFTLTSLDARGFDDMTASYGGVAITLSVKGLP